MGNRTTKLILIAFSLIFALRVATIFTADRCYSMSLAAEKGKITPDRAITLLNIATALDSTNAELYSKKFDILRLKDKEKSHHPSPITHYSSPMTHHEILKQQLHLMNRCITLCPSWPAYHLYYALTLSQMSPRPNIQTRKLILSELQKTKELKPYSNLYRQICQKYQKQLTS